MVSDYSLFTIDCTLYLLTYRHIQQYIHHQQVLSLSSLSLKGVVLVDIPS
jgi:hypothetical protein